VPSHSSINHSYDRVYFEHVPEVGT
jgi:hypothetical protein